jgi:GntR family transcriptional repressor for pyruvate dehydrogenase complex
MVYLKTVIGKRMRQTKKSAPQHAAEIIQQRIQSNIYSAGQSLPGQRELAEDLGVGRPAIREAVSALESLGLLRVEAGRGVFVAEPGSAPVGDWRFGARYSLENVYAVRGALEALSARLATQHATPRQIKRVERLVDQLELAVDNDDLLTMSSLDREFHRTLAKASGNPLLLEMLDAFESVMTESRNVAFMDSNRKNRIAPAKEHRQIVESIKAGDANAASRNMKKHIAHAQNRAGLVHILGVQTKARNKNV